MYNLQDKLLCRSLGERYNQHIKIGDIVKIDLEYIMSISNGLIPKWYLNCTFRIVRIDYYPDTPDMLVYLDKELPGAFNMISMEYLKIDIVGERKKKLERIGNVG